MIIICYYNGDADYIILPNDKEKRKRNNDNNTINNNDDDDNYSNIKGEKIFKRFNDNNENSQYIGGKSGYDIYVKEQKEIDE
jgi:hypothetical protein